MDSLERLVSSINALNEDEIIVVDDCSHNQIYASLKELSNNYKFTLLKTTVNSGAGAARNLGVQHAKNDWLIFADSDDFFVKGYREKIEDYLLSNKDVIYFKPTSLKESNNKSIRGNRHWYYEYLIDSYLNEQNNKNLNLIKYQMVVPWSKIVRRSLIIDNNILFDEVPVSNDVFFSTLIGFYSKSVEVSSNVIYCCVENDQSLTSDISYEKYFKRLSIFQKQYQFLEKNLEKKEFRNLNLTGMSMVIQSFKYKYTLKEKKEIIKYMRMNKIKIFSLAWVISILERQIKLSRNEVVSEDNEKTSK